MSEDMGGYTVQDFRKFKPKKGMSFQEIALAAQVFLKASGNSSPKEKT